MTTKFADLNGITARIEITPRAKKGPYVNCALIAESSFIEYEDSATYHPPESVSFSGTTALKNLWALLDEALVEIGKLEFKANNNA